MIWRLKRMLSLGHASKFEHCEIAVEGSSTCLSFALTQLYPANPRIRERLDAALAGPLTYREAEHLCGATLTVCGNDSDDLAPGDYLVHEPRAVGDGPGHASAVRVLAGDTAVVFDQQLGCAALLSRTQLKDLNVGGKRVVTRVNGADTDVSGSTLASVVSLGGRALLKIAAAGDNGGKSSSSDDEEQCGASDLTPASHGMEALLVAVDAEKRRLTDDLSRYNRGRAMPTWQCPFCVRRVFQHKDRLVHHLTTTHESWLAARRESHCRS